jgi:hypothetical protein
VKRNSVHIWVNIKTVSINTKDNIQKENSVMTEQVSNKGRISRRSLMKATGVSLALGAASCTPATQQQQPPQTFGCMALPLVGAAKPAPKDRSFLDDLGFKNVTVDGKKGYQVQLRCTGYRGIPLWSVQEVALKVDGKDVSPKDMTFILEGNRYKATELKNQKGVQWWVLSYGTLFVPKADGMTPGEHDIEVTMNYISTYGRRSMASGPTGITTQKGKKRLTLEAEI